jgi:hypothetical protein
MHAPFAQAMSTSACARPRRGTVLIRWWSGAAALAIMLAIPFFLVDVPPVLDYPNHLARFFVLAHPEDPVLSEMYAPNWRILPNLGMDVIGALLLRLVDVHVGGRLLLALSLFAPVAGVIVYHRAVFARRSLWPLASALVAYNGVFFLGFMNFLLALGLALCAAGGWIVLRRQGMIWTAVVFGACAAAITFMCHLFGVLFFAVLISAYEAERLWSEARSTRSAGEALRAAASIGAALSPALLLYYLSPLDAASAPLGVWLMIGKPWWIFAAFMTPSPSLTLLTAVAVLSVLMLVRRQLRLAPGLRLALAVLFLAFVAAPQSMGTGTFVDVRFALMIGLLLFAGVEPELNERQAASTCLVIGALVVARSAYIGATWVSHRQDLAEVRAAIAIVEPGTRVLPARGHPGSMTDVVRAERALPGLYRTDSHVAALLLIERRAFCPLLFAYPGQQPLIVLRPYDALSGVLSEPADWPLLAKAEQPAGDQSAPAYSADWQVRFDNVLLIDPAAAMPSVPGLSLLHAGGYAQLYRIDHVQSGVQQHDSDRPTRSSRD